MARRFCWRACCMSRCCSSASRIIFFSGASAAAAVPRSSLSLRCSNVAACASCCCCCCPSAKAMGSRMGTGVAVSSGWKNMKKAKDSLPFLIKQVILSDQQKKKKHSFTYDCIVAKCAWRFKPPEGTSVLMEER